MKDNLIKEILKNSKTPPDKPTNEWAYILKEIKRDKEKSKFFEWRYLLGTMACSLVIVFIYNSMGINSVGRVGVDLSEEALNEYFMESTYIDEEDDDQELYAWIDF